MKPVLVETLQIHNDVRIHPQKTSGRTFRIDQGYTIEWYPPHLFRVTIPMYNDRPVDDENPLHERWFAITNCESWVLVKSNAPVNIPEIEALIAIGRQIAEIKSLVSNLVEMPKPANVSPKSLK